MQNKEYCGHITLKMNTTKGNAFNLYIIHIIELLKLKIFKLIE